MTALYIIGGILAFFLLAGLIPVGADIRYDENGLLLKLRIWFIGLTLGGAKKPGKQKKRKKKKDPEGAEKPKTKGKLPPIKVLLILIQNAFAMLGRVVSRFRVEALKLHVTAASPDPASAAMIYAALGTGMDMLLNLGRDRAGRADLRADVDFDASAPLIDLRLVLRVRIGAVVNAALGFGWGFLKDYLRYKKEG